MVDDGYAEDELIDDGLAAAFAVLMHRNDAVMADRLEMDEPEIQDND